MGSVGSERSRDIPIVDVDPFAPEILCDPYLLHPQLRDRGPVVFLSRYDIFAMGRHAEVSAALLDWRRFTSARGVGLADFDKEEPWRPKSLLLEADPPAHDRMRVIANKVVSLMSLRAVRDAWKAEAEALADKLVEQGRFDGIAELAEVYPQRVFADAIGLREDGRALLIPYAAATFNAFGPRNAIFASTEPQGLAAAPWVEESCTRPFIQPGGWGEAFFAAADRDECSEYEAARLMRSLITAGFDTTINALGNMLDVLVDEPAAWSAIRAQPIFAKRALEEALRLRSPVQTFFRTTTEDVEIEEFTIPAGSKVLLFLGAANRDPRRWPDPDKFDLTRSTSGHVAFGHGVHQCLGQMVARQEGELVLTALVERIATLSRDGPAVRRPNNTLYALSTLPLIAQN
jgi:4-methoxybenzoate monooxygenase (O-demethylating)